jgi:tol-pal system protein YbgF
MKVLKCCNHILLGLVVIFGANISAFAEAPVEDLTQEVPQGGFEVQPLGNEFAPPATAPATQDLNQPLPAPPVPPPTQNMTMSQRMMRVEQQLNNLIQMNLVGKYNDLEQQIQQLRGQLETQTHELKLLNEQQKKFYEDLDQRLSRISQDNNSDKNPIEKSSAMMPKNKETKTETKIAETKKSDSSKLDSPKSDSAEQEVYLSGFNALKAKKYAQATTALRDYTTRFPQGKYAANAHYWLGEIYYLKGENQKAATEFNKVITNHPTSDKVTNAFLKTAFIHANMGKTTQAKQELLKIKKQFPGSSAARLADMRLKELQQPKSTD